MFTLRSSLSGRLVIAFALLVASAALADAAIAGSGRGSASIHPLTVAGGPSNPIFTIEGNGLSIPKPNQSNSPSNQKLCPLNISGNAGLDYGTPFYILAWPAGINDTNNLMNAAGRYRPSRNELDCVGIVVKSQSPTHVTLTLGHA
jgi:hypothetical protein